MVKRLFLILLGALAAVSCTHKPLSEENPCGDQPVKVVIHWDDPATQARSMRINIFSQTAGVPSYGRDDVPSTGIKYIYLDGADYRPFCYDYNAPNIYFRNEQNMETFEAYFSGVSRPTYDAYGSPVAGEGTYSSPTGDEFYVHGWTDAISIIENSPEEQVIDFYPKNILRQFTYRVYNIIGAENIQEARGAASGMAAVFNFFDDSPTEERSTMMFGSVRIGYDNEKEYGYLEGEFYTFYPRSPYENRFSIELYSKAGKYYGSYWDVSNQVAESMADRAAKLARDGFDILLRNNPDTDIPSIDPGEGGSDGGFDIGVGEWGDEVIVEL